MISFESTRKKRTNAWVSAEVGAVGGLPRSCGDEDVAWAGAAPTVVGSTTRHSVTEFVEAEEVTEVPAPQTANEPKPEVKNEEEVEF